MNHLREIVETVDAGSTRVVNDISTTSDQKIRSLVGLLAESAVCFYGGDTSSFAGMKPIPDLCKRLPYECCYFEFSVSATSVIVGVLAQQRDESIDILVFRKRTQVWHLMAVVSSDGEQIRGEANKEVDGSGAWVLDIFGLVRLFITAMRCNNVEIIESPQPEKLQKARIARGKKPLFSYWTLELKQERADGAALGGTHSSPRLHLRRGHPRQFAPGKWTWVQPCVVGNKQAGMVHKDYRLAA